MKNFKLINTFVSAFFVSASLFAQGLPPVGQQQSTKGAVIKGKAPVSKEILKVKLPRPFETKLSNGVQVMIMEDHSLPNFSMQMTILSGGMSDQSDNIGVAQYTATLLREGTKTRNSKQIAEQVDALGATLFANAGLTSLTSTVAASGLTENMNQVMELFADVLLNPNFPADEFNKLKTRALGSLRLNRANPNFLAGEMMAKMMYGNHPGGRFNLTAADLQKLSPEALQKFHATYYKQNNAIFSIVGDVNPKETIALLEKTFGNWQKGEATAPNIPAVSGVGAAKIALIDRPGSAQTNLVLTSQGITRDDPDYFAVEIMNQVLGGSASARLFLNLREDKGYTYGAYSNVSTYKYRGGISARTEVRTEVTEGSMKELFYELKRLQEEKVPEKELENAKRSIVGGFALQLESPGSVLSDMLTLKLYGFPADYWDTYPVKIAAVTADDVQRVARKYLVMDKLQVVAVGDAAKIIEGLKKYGSLDLYDTDGKLKVMN